MKTNQLVQVLHKCESLTPTKEGPRAGQLAVGKTFRFRSGDGYTVQENGSLVNADPKPYRTKAERKLYKRARQAMRQDVIPARAAADRDQVSAYARSGMIELAGDSLPDSIQVFPPGESVEFTLCDYPGEVFHMRVDPAVAGKANSQLQAMLAKAQANQGAFPYADKNHEDGEATFHPSEFFWGGDDAKTGGVRLRGTWTGLGEQLVRAKAFRYFSGNFLFSRSAKKFLGLINENIGGLVNRPGFATQQAFAKGDASNQKQNQTMTDQEIQNAITNGITAGLKPVITRLDTLEAQAKGETATQAQAGADNKVIDLFKNELKTALDPIKQQLAGFETREKDAIKAAAKAAVQKHVARGAIAPADTAGIEFWENAYVANAAAAETQMTKLAGKSLPRIITGQGSTATSTSDDPQDQFIARARAWAKDRKDLKNDAEIINAFAVTAEGNAAYQEIHETRKAAATAK